MKRRLPWLVLIIAVTALVAGCVIPRPKVHRSLKSAEACRGASMKNDTDDVTARIPCAGRWWRPCGTASTWCWIQGDRPGPARPDGINLGGQLDLTTPQKLGETLEVEGVLYGELIDFRRDDHGHL